jgi:hypothetical protein
MAGSCSKCGLPTVVERRGHWEKIACPTCGVLFGGTALYPRDLGRSAAVYSIEVRRTESISVSDALRWLRHLPDGEAVRLHSRELYPLLKEREWIRLPGQAPPDAGIVTAARAAGFDVRLIES